MATLAVAHSYSSLLEPIVEREGEVTPIEVGEGRFQGETGGFTVAFGTGVLSDAILVSQADTSIALALRPLGAEANLLKGVQRIEPMEASQGNGVQLSGQTEWARFVMELYLYPTTPGLLRYRVQVEPLGPPLTGQVAPEWQWVDPTTGTEAAANYEGFAERASFAAPMMYGFSETMDATLLYWLDLTALNPFIEATHYQPAATVDRSGRTFGHTLTRSDLQKLQDNTTVILYDGYLSLRPSRPSSESQMFLDYLQQAGDIYDLIEKPPVQLPDWQALAQATLQDLEDPDTWVELEGKRFWRAYVSDSRQSAEAITQIDVGLAAARYAARFDDEQAGRIASMAEATLEDFYNPQFGLVQNSGPLAVTGNQGRGDTWYELGHVLKLAEWGQLGSTVAADIAQRSAEAWIAYAHAVDYRFHRFYNFPDPNNPDAAWTGSEQEPDVAGGYAYYMLLLHEQTGETRFLEEARAAVERPGGQGVLACLRDAHHRTGSRSLRAPLATDGGGTIFGTGLRSHRQPAAAVVGLGGRLWARSGGAHLLGVKSHAALWRDYAQGAVRGVDLS